MSYLEMMHTVCTIPYNNSLMVVQYYNCRHNYKVSGLWLPSIVVATTMYMYVRWVKPSNFGVHMHAAGVAYLPANNTVYISTRGSYMHSM